jgi:hypothetical protein
MSDEWLNEEANFERLLALNNEDRTEKSKSSRIANDPYSDSTFAAAAAVSRLAWQTPAALSLVFTAIEEVRRALSLSLGEDTIAICHTQDAITFGITDIARANDVVRYRHQGFEARVRANIELCSHHHRQRAIRIG